MRVGRIRQIIAAVCKYGLCNRLHHALTLLVLNQMKIETGELRTSGTFAYVSQEVVATEMQTPVRVSQYLQAWIQSATVKENIVFGFDFDEARYHEVL